MNTGICPELVDNGGGTDIINVAKTSKGYDTDLYLSNKEKTRKGC